MFMRAVRQGGWLKLVGLLFWRRVLCFVSTGRDILGNARPLLKIPQGLLIRFQARLAWLNRVVLHLSHFAALCK